MGASEIGATAAPSLQTKRQRCAEQGGKSWNKKPRTNTLLYSADYWFKKNSGRATKAISKAVEFWQCLNKDLMHTNNWAGSDKINVQTNAAQHQP